MLTVCSTAARAELVVTLKFHVAPKTQYFERTHKSLGLGHAVQQNHQAPLQLQASSEAQTFARLYIC